MTDTGELSRRDLFAAFCVALLGLPHASHAAPGDQGIGGTGRPNRHGRPDPDPDQGIGGTGIIGILRGFGSIVVNDLHIAYSSDVEIFYDGRRVRVDALRIGQGISVVARPASGRLQTMRIDIASETSGLIERRRAGEFVVLGQRVRPLDSTLLHAFAPGDRVAVHGLRRLDGVIEATLIEAVSSDTPDRIVGRVIRNGSLTIGAMPVDGLPHAVIGRRVAIEGQLRGGRLRAFHVVDLLGELATRADHVIIESYVGTTGGNLNLGLGFPIGGPSPKSVLPGAEQLGILSATIGTGGHLRPDTFRAAPGDRPDAQGEPRPGRDPIGDAPLDRGPRPDQDHQSRGGRHPSGPPRGNGEGPRETGRSSGGGPPGSSAGPSGGPSRGPDKPNQ